MGKRTVAVCGAAVLVAGLLVFRWSGPDAPPDVPAEPVVRVRVGIGDRDTERGWLLMASEQVARRTPPEDVVDCRALHAWALREGALPVGVAAHTIRISADRDTAIESTSVRVVPDPTHYPADGGAPVVRLRCLPRVGAAPAFPDPADVDFRVDDTPRRVTFDQRRRVAPGADAAFDVLVDLTGTTGPFAYRVEVGVDAGGGIRMVPVNDGHDVFFATEDGGGMGYWPATTTWTMSPARTRTHCPAVSDPGPDRSVDCAN
ncbi:hypothetical protein ACFYOT_23385 [Saccharothrix saharensis]|uniref:hypothetical protein n=1 Tax=Saccharothrix saharensis TaxID=571190 RepID=UPI0036B40A26